MTEGKEIPAILQTFLMDMIEESVKRDIRCCMDNFRCDDVNELWTSDSDSSESSFSSESEEEWKWIWRADITLSKGEHVSKGILRHYSYPCVGMEWTNSSGEPMFFVKSRNMVEFMDFITNKSTSTSP